MRPGPPTAALARLSWGVMLDVLRAGRVLAADLPVEDVRLEWTADRVVPGRLTYSLPLAWTPAWPLDPAGVFGQRSRPLVVCRDETTRREWTTPLGQFLHVGWQETGGAVQVSGVDLMQVLEESPMPWPSSPPAGASLSTEARRLAGGMPVVLDPGVADGPVSASTQWGCSRSESLVKLAQSRSCGVRSGPDGALHVYPLRDASSAPDVTYEAASTPFGPGNGLLLGVEATPRQVPRRPNRWVVTATHKDGDTEEQWTATRTATQPPFDVAGYGEVTKHEEFSAADSRGAVEAAVDTYMRQDLAALQPVTARIVPDPRLEVGDVVALVQADGSTLAGRVHAYSMQIGGADMRVDLDVLEW